MTHDRTLGFCSQARPHRSTHGIALWVCAQVLLFSCCHGLQEHIDGLLDAPKAPRHQRHRTTPAQLLPGHRQLLQLNTGNTAGATGLHRSLHAFFRQLRASTAAKSSANGGPNPAMLPYPREAGAVKQYLDDALQFGAAPYTIPVWFVVVVDPNNAAVTNVTEEQLQSQVHLLNNAYRTGLPDSEGIIAESGSYASGSRASVHSPKAAVAVGANMVRREGAAAAIVNVHARPKSGTGGLLTANQQQQQQGGTTQVAKHRQLAAAAVNSRISSRKLWRFELHGVKYVSRPEPMCVGSSSELDLKKFWRPHLVQEGNSRPDGTLIVYVSQMSRDKCRGKVPGYSVLFGYGTSPYDLVMWKQHKQEYRDGVVIDPEYLLNNRVQKESGQGSDRGAASGAQLVHEVGHWLGLQHTFEGGCTTDEAKTDQVYDTPSEALPKQWGVSLKDASAGCAYRDSCGDIVGPDMYYNYMTYMNLGCARTFTAGQHARMLYMFRAVREH